MPYITSKNKLLTALLRRLLAGKVSRLRLARALLRRPLVNANASCLQW